MTEAQLISNKNYLQFYDIDKLYFPKICLVCGSKTDNTIRKSLTGNFTYTKIKRKDYQLNIPVCKKCVEKSQIQKSKESLKVIIPSIAGLIIALILYFFTLSVIIGIAVCLLSTIIPLLSYRSKVSKKIDINKYVKLNSKSPNTNEPEDILELEFLSENYAEYLSKLNLEQNDNLTKVKGFKYKKVSEGAKEIICPNCKASISSDLKFCTNCGTKIGLPSKEPDIDVKLSTIPLDKNELPKADPNQQFNSGSNIAQNSQLETIKQVEDDSNESSLIACPHCSNSVPSDSIFCTSCGKSIQNTQKSPEIFNPTVSSPISKEQPTAPIKCPNCGQYNSARLSFCTKCGSKF